MARTYDLVADLPLTIDGYTLEGFERGTAFFTRRTTVITLTGGGHEGKGEDVTYDADEQLAQQEAGPVLPLAGDWTIDSFSTHLESLDLFGGREIAMPSQAPYRTWAFESAALDLALRQAGTNLHDLLGREARPLTFGVSLRLGDPQTAEPVLDRIEAYGDVRFKIDYNPSWDAQLIADLQATGAVDVIDLKGQYKGTVVDVDTVPAIYKACAEAFTDAWLEDPDLDDPEAAAVLEPYLDRVTWDAPTHSVDDITSLPHQPRCTNSKPSRFGAIHRLLDFYDHCEAEGIALYGGGQSELSVGRGQIQLLAAIFHPDGPNDVAPSGWDHDDFPREGLPTSPLDPNPDTVGFRRA